MIHFLTKKIFVLMACAVIVLTGCESDEEKASRYFSSATTLLEAGDEERALVELRNVFKYDGFHKEARETYAGILLKQGDVGGAVSQYLRLIEQYPDALEARYVLAETAITSGDWQEAERHGTKVLELDPDALRSKVIRMMLDYRAAAVASDDQQRKYISDQARDLITQGSQSNLLEMVVIDYLSNSDNPLDALPYIDASIERDPNQFNVQLSRFRILAATEDAAGTGAQLKRMYAQFPDSFEIKQLLITWFMEQGDSDGAEAFLRDLAAQPDAKAGEQANLIQFLLSVRGPEAGIAELERVIAQTEDPEERALYNRLYATVDFEQGRIDEAIARLQTLLEQDNDAAPDMLAPTRVLLAQVLDSQGDLVGARALVEEILLHDPSNTNALKLRANWLINEDKLNEAIIDLRTALNQSPRDSQILSLMALAHEREGNIDLASERLALAVEVSGEAPVEALRYAKFLSDRGRLSIASTVLRSSLNKAPANLELLTALANVYLKEQDWVRAQEISTQLRAQGSPDALRTAQYLQAAILSGQDRIEESLAFLQDQFSSETEVSERATTAVLIVQNLLRSNRLDAALTIVDEQILELPDNLGLKILKANILAITGDLDLAEEEYRKLIEIAPDSDLPVRLLLKVLFATDRSEDANALLEQSLITLPDSEDLNWMQASLFEQANDIEGAIAIYEKLYAINPANLIASNNLASLLVAHDANEQNLERAYTVSRRLREEPVPQFQDTYGWVQHLRGDTDVALTYLEKSYASLPSDPQINYHLGAVYASLGRTEDARTALTRAVEFFGDNPSKTAQDAKALLQSLP